MILVLSILLVFILAGAVSAASDDVDNNLTDSGSEDVMALDSVEESDTVSTDAVDENTEVLADDNTVGSFSDLNNFLKENKGFNKTITLNKDYVFNQDTDGELLDGIDLQGYVTIDGKGHTLDGNNSDTRFFTI